MKVKTDPALIENAVMLYQPRAGAPLIDGREVDCKMFDRDSETFEADSEGWLTHAEAWGLGGGGDANDPPGDEDEDEDADDPPGGEGADAEENEL